MLRPLCAKHLNPANDQDQIEFPSILLPPSISSGSIVDITVSRNYASETTAHKTFQALQSSILAAYGQHSPSPPLLRCRNATQTSVVLEWDPIDLATADLRSLSLYRNGSKAGSIPRPLDITATKISGLAIDTEYVFHLVLRTSAGQYSSEKLVVRTHKMTDLSGITVTPGVLPAPLRESLSGAVERIGAKLADSVRIDTTHFVCTEGRGREWEKAVEMNIPVVRPEWIEGCEREGRIVGVRGYYLNADPRLRQVGQGLTQSSSVPQRQRQPRRGDSPPSSPQLRVPPHPQADVPIRPTPSSQHPSPRPPASPNNEETGPPPPEKDTPQPLPTSPVSDDESEDGSGDVSSQPSGLGVLSAKKDPGTPSPIGPAEDRGRESSTDGGIFTEVTI